MWEISILADFRPMVSFHAGVVFGLSTDFLFKSTQGHCTVGANRGLIRGS